MWHLPSLPQIYSSWSVFTNLGYICKEQICANPFFRPMKDSMSITKFTLGNTSIIYINNKEQKHVVTCATGTSISRVSRLTGAIMRPLGIVTDRIDVTVMGVNHTLVNIYEGKFPTWEKYIQQIVSQEYKIDTENNIAVTEENNFVLNNWFSTTKSNKTNTWPQTNKEKSHVLTNATTSISRVSRRTGTIMRSLGIITDSIDVTVMGVCCTLISIYEKKLPTWETFI